MLLLSNWGSILLTYHGNIKHCNTFNVSAAWNLSSKLAFKIQQKNPQTTALSNYYTIWSNYEPNLGQFTRKSWLVLEIGAKYLNDAKKRSGIASVWALNIFQGVKTCIVLKWYLNKRGYGRVLCLDCYIQFHKLYAVLVNSSKVLI